MGLFSRNRKKEKPKEKTITPEMALEKLNRAKSEGTFLGEQYSYYANIAGRLFEDDMLNELSTMEINNIFIWEDQQKKSGKYFTNTVFEKVKELEEKATQHRNAIFEEQDKATKLESEGKIPEATEQFAFICQNFNYPLFSVDRLTILYRKAKEYDKEIMLCENFIAKHGDALGARADKIRKRLLKAKQLKEKNS